MNLFKAMLKLFDLKKPGANGGGAGGSAPRTGPSAAYLRLQKGKLEFIFIQIIKSVKSLKEIE